MNNEQRRVHYKDEDVMNKIAVVAFSAGHFGVQCDLERVKGEIETFSDFDIHQLCLMYPSALGQFQLNSHTLYESPKMQTLKLMLPMLQVILSYFFVYVYIYQNHKDYLSM